MRLFKLVFYIMGNHEPYGSIYSTARAALRDFEADVERQRGLIPGVALGRFILLDRDKYELQGVTILGCTLFSHIRSEQRDSVSMFVSDFSEIADWNVDAHNNAHHVGVDWLNYQIQEHTQYSPCHKIVILTHYSPT